MTVRFKTLLDKSIRLKMVENDIVNRKAKFILTYASRFNFNHLNRFIIDSPKYIYIK